MQLCAYSFLTPTLSTYLSNYIFKSCRYFIDHYHRWGVKLTILCSPRQFQPLASGYGLSIYFITSSILTIRDRVTVLCLHLVRRFNRLSNIGSIRLPWKSVDRRRWQCKKANRTFVRLAEAGTPYSANERSSRMNPSATVSPDYKRLSSQLCHCAHARALHIRYANIAFILRS